MSHLLPPLPFERTLITAPSEQLHSHFLQKDQTWLSLFCLSPFFPLSFFIYLTKRSEGRKWNLFVVYYESTTSLLNGENRSKSFERYIIIMTKIRVFPFLWAVSEVTVQKNLRSTSVCYININTVSVLKCELQI